MLKYILSFLILIGGPLIINGQVTLKLLKNQVFYLGIENPVILLNKSDTVCIDSIKSSSSVEIKKASNGCFYYIKPKSKIQPAFIEIKNQKIDFTHKITLSPDPVWNVKIQDGYLNLEKLKSLSGISFIQPYFNYDTEYIVESVFIRIIRNNQLVYTETAKRGIFTNKFKSELMIGDHVDFTSISLDAPEGIRKVESISFKIKN